jgi:hypothetical protein
MKLVKRYAKHAEATKQIQTVFSSNAVLIRHGFDVLTLFGYFFKMDLTTAGPRPDIPEFIVPDPHAG